MWSIILLMSHLPGGHSMSYGPATGKARLPTVLDSLLFDIGQDQRIICLSTSPKFLSGMKLQQQGFVAMTTRPTL